MKQTIFIFTLLLLVPTFKSDAQTSIIYQSETLKVKQINPNIFVHVSYLQTEDYGKVAANGMVYFNTDEAIIFDTPVNNKASQELIDWIKKEHQKKIKAVIITHFHNDSLGGLKTFHKSNIASYANTLTIDLAKEGEVETLPQHAFNKRKKLKVGDTSILIKFFGEGHTKDNVVGYIQEEQALFGGCLVKTLKARKGYLGDANLNEWSNTILKIKKVLPDLKIIVPGHGKHRDTSLLDYTAQLFSQSK